MRRPLLIPAALILLPLIFSMLPAQSVEQSPQRPPETILLTTRGRQNVLATACYSTTACGSQGAVRGARVTDTSLRVDEVEQSEAFMGAIGQSNLTPSNLGLEEMQVSASGTDASKGNCFSCCRCPVMIIRDDAIPESPAAPVEESAPVATAPIRFE